MSELRSMTTGAEQRRTVSVDRTAAAKPASGAKTPPTLLITLQKKLPRIALFLAGLLIGWLVVGGLLVPLPGPRATPEDLTAQHQSIYLQMAADSYASAGNGALIQEALAGWEPRELAQALAQAEAAATDQAGRRRVAALRNLLDIPVRPVTLVDFVRQQGPIYITLSLSALMFILAGGVIVVPQLRGALAPDSDAAPAAAGVAAAEGAGVFVFDEGETLDDLINAIAEGANRKVAETEAPTTTQEAGQQAGVTASEREAAPDLATAMAQDTNGPGQAGDGPDAESSDQAGGAVRDGEGLAEQGRGAEPGRVGEGGVQGAAPAGPDIPSPNMVAPVDVPARDAPSAKPVKRDAVAAMQAGAGPAEGTPSMAFPDMLSPNDDGANGGFPGLLLDEVFSRVFDIEDIFDPNLRAISQSLDDVDIRALRKKGHLVNMQLQARHLLPEPEKEDASV